MHEYRPFKSAELCAELFFKHLFKGMSNILNLLFGEAKTADLWFSGFIYILEKYIFGLDEHNFLEIVYTNIF